MNIKKRFEGLSKKEVIQLYLIVLISYTLIYILYTNNKSVNILSDQVIINNVNKKIKQSSDLEFLNYFAQVSKKYNIIIDEVKISKNTIDIKTEETYRNMMLFFTIVNKIFHIKSFEITKEKQTLDFVIRLDKKVLKRNLFVDIKKKQEIIQELENPFVKKSTKIFEKIPEIIMSAIIKDEVLIDNNWYKKGDEIYEYKIDSILREEKKVVFIKIKTNEKIIKRIIDG